jgi:hypothetical protein
MQRSEFPPSLRNPIYLSDAPSTGLARQLGAPPSETCRRIYKEKETRARFRKLHKILKVDRNCQNVSEQRLRALAELKFGISPHAPDWWDQFFKSFAIDKVPGLTTKETAPRKPGNQPKWLLTRSAQLFADIEFEKQRTKKSDRSICEWLTKTKAYHERWGSYEPEALRKAHQKTLKKIRKKDREFAIELGHLITILPNNQKSLTEVAIELHALKATRKNIGEPIKASI